MIVRAEAMKQDFMAPFDFPPNDSVKSRFDTAASMALNYVSSSLELHENGMYLSHLCIDYIFRTLQRINLPRWKALRENCATFAHLLNETPPLRSTASGLPTVCFPFVLPLNPTAKNLNYPSVSHLSRQTLAPLLYWPRFCVDPLIKGRRKLRDTYWKVDTTQTLPLISIRLQGSGLRMVRFPYGLPSISVTVFLTSVPPTTHQLVIYPVKQKQF